AGDRLAGDAGDRLIAAAAALDRIARAAPDRLVATAAADDRLIAAGAIDGFVAAAATGERVAGSAADRLVAAAPAAERVPRAAVAQKDPIIPSAVDEAVIAVQHRQGCWEALAGGSLDQDALIARRRRIIARAGRIDHDFEVELAGNRRRGAVGVICQRHIDGLIWRKDIVMTARYRRHVRPER